MLGRDFVMVGAAKVGAQQTREITDKEWLQSCGARADYRCIDFRKALLKLLNGIPCVVCRGHQRFQEGGSTNCDGTNTAKKMSAGRHSKRRGLYKLPVAKIAQTLIFGLLGICNRSMTGIKSNSVKTSMMMLSIESAMYFVS